VSTPRDWRRRLNTTLLAITGALTLTACRVEIATTVNVADNGSGTINVSAIADATAVRLAPELGESLNLDDLRTAGWTVEVQNPAPDGGLTVVAERPFANPDEATFFLAQVGGEGGPLRNLQLSRSGGVNDANYVFTGTAGLSNGLAGFADAEALAVLGGTPLQEALARSGRPLNDMLTMSLQLTVPGQVVQADGVVAARDASDAASTIRWEIPVDGATLAMNATTRDRDVSAIVASVVARVLLVLMIVLVAAAVLYVATVVQRRSRTTPSS
jgi:hypothetical protein